MSTFTDDELEYLHNGRKLARVATVGPDGTPHVVPVGWSHSAELDTIEVGGRDFAASKLAPPRDRGPRPAPRRSPTPPADPHPPRADRLLGVDARGRYSRATG